MSNVHYLSIGFRKMDIALLFNIISNLQPKITTGAKYCNGFLFTGKSLESLSTMLKEEKSMSASASRLAGEFHF